MSRLKRAASLLASSGMTVAEIAYEVGFLLLLILQNVTRNSSARVRGIFETERDVRGNEKNERMKK